MITTTYKCDRCGHEIQIGEYPFCPHGFGAGTSIRDEIPGGIVLENYGPDPIKVYSHSERRRIMKDRGLEEFVRHTPVPGTDKSPHTIDFGAMIDPQTMRNAEELVKRSSRVADDGIDFSPAIRPFNTVGDQLAADTMMAAVETFELQGGNRRRG